MTQEEKAKAYDEAIEKAKIWQEHLYDVNDKDYADELNYIFPELKESEDERIRKWIKKELESKYVVDNIINDVMADKALAWLEKQGEQKSADKVEPKFHEGDWVAYDGWHCQITEVREDGYCNSMNGFIPKEREDSMHLIITEPAEWSEEDELSCFESALFTAFSYAWQSYLLGEEVNVKQWAKEQSKELLEAAKEELKGNNTAWSEEDESRMDNLCHFLEEYGNQYYGHLTLQVTISWLKSLRPPYYCDNCKLKKSIQGWKPSDEQMFALNIAIEMEDGDILKSLYQDLLKLREE